ncbi:hypothetical protein ACLBXX_20565, partial [Microbacterium sp. C23T]
MTVEAKAAEDWFLLAIAGGVSLNSVAVTGAVIVFVFDQGGSDPKVRAHIGANSEVHATGAVTVAASREMEADVAAGNLAIGGGSAGVGASAVVVVRGSTVEAEVGAGADIRAGGAGLTVSAIQSADLLLLAVGGSGGGTAGVAGSVVVNTTTDVTKASLLGSVSQPTTNVAVKAQDDTTILSLAGQLTYGGTAGVGAGVDVEVLNKTTEAWIGNDAVVRGSGNLTVDAISTEGIDSISVGGGFGGTAAVNVNAGVSVINVTTRAFVQDGTSASDRADLEVSGSVRVAASDRLRLNVIAGNISGGGTAAVGAAVAVPVVTKSTRSFIGAFSRVIGLGNGAALDVVTGGYTVTTQDTRFDPSVALEGGGVINLGFAHGFQNGDEVIYDSGYGANIAGLDDTPGDEVTPQQVYYVEVVDAFRVKLHHQQDLQDAAIGVSGGTGESHRLIPTDQAGVRKDDSLRFNPLKAGAIGAGGLITLPYDHGFSDGDTVVYSSGGGSPISGLIDGGTYYAETSGLAPNQLKLRNKPEDKGGVILTGLGIVNTTGRGHSIVKSGVTPGGDASAYGPRVVELSTDTFRGVAVTASSSDDIAVVGISAGVAGTAAVNLAGAVNVDNVHTYAWIGDSARINCNADCSAATAGSSTAQSVLVAAASQFYHLGIAGALSIAGSAAVAIPVGVRVVNLNTRAHVGSGAIVRARGDIAVTARAKDAVVSVVVGAGGGTVGVAATVAVSILNTKTYACTGTPAGDGATCTSGGATLRAGNNVLVLASDDTKAILITAAIAGGVVGVGAAVGIALLTKDTQASLGAGSVVDAAATGAGLPDVYAGTITGDRFDRYGAGAPFHGVAIQASSSEDVFGLVPAIGGGFVGVAGGIAVTLLRVTTKAFIAAGSLVNTLAGASAAQSVNVSAVDRFKSLTIAGGAAGGFVGVAGGIDIGIADTSVQAAIGAGATVQAGDDVEVFALSVKDVSSIAVSIAGGAVGLAISLSIWAIGVQQSGTYHQADGGRFRGEYSSAVANDADLFYLKGDVVTSGGKRWAATIDHANDTPGTSGEWEGETDAAPTAKDNTDEADSIAKGDGGYKDALNGTTSTRTFTAWSNAVSYDKDDASSYVTFNGHKYRPTGNSTTVGASPEAKPSEWVMIDGEEKTNSRVVAAMAGASSGIAAAAPTTGLTADAVAIPPAGGTTASVDGVISAGRSVRVWAIDDLEILGIAGAIGGGFVGGGGSVLVLNIRSRTEASVGENAQITAGAGGADEISVRAAMTEHGLGFGLAAGGGFVGIGGQVTVIKDTSTQFAHIDSGAQLRRAGGRVLLESVANRSLEVYSIGVAVGAGAVGFAIAYVSVDGDNRAVSGYDPATTLENGTVAVGAGGVVGKYEAKVTDNVTVTALGISLAGGAVGIGGVLTFVELGGTARASAAPVGTIGAGGVSVTADGSRTVGVTTLNVTVGAFALGVTVARANSSRHLESALRGNTTTTGQVTVRATADNEASVTAPAGGGGGVSVQIQVVFAVLSGHTLAEVAGSVTNASGITVEADAENRATSDTVMGGIALIGLAGAWASVEVTSAAWVRATVASGTLNSTGIIAVTAKTHGDGSFAKAIVDAISGGLIDLKAMIAIAEVDNEVAATMNGAVTGATAVRVRATAGSTAEARVLTAAIALVSLAIGAAYALVSGETFARGAGSLGASGADYDVTATSTNRATAFSNVITGGFLGGVAVSAPVAEIGAQTGADWSGTVTSGHDLTVKADADNEATATAKVLSTGIIGVSGAEGKATIAAPPPPPPGGRRPA